MTGTFTQRLGIELPLLQAPMAGSSGVELAMAVSRSGALASLPCAMLHPEQIREAVFLFRERAPGPINLNFFCHAPPPSNTKREMAWKDTLSRFYRELGVDTSLIPSGPLRRPFGEAECELVEELRPQVVSFHFGLPPPALVRRVRSSGATILSSATTVAEAQWLEQHGCDAVIAQGLEAGGHRGMFLTRDLSTQAGTMVLVPQVADAVKVPVIAAGGIMDARTVEAAFSLGASAVQLGTAYLRCRECDTGQVHRRALEGARPDSTVITNIFTGRPARGLVNQLIRELGSVRDDVPEFPTASAALTPLRALAESQGSGDFSPLWAGQGVALSRETDVASLTASLFNARRAAAP
jgi:nitronate monooxygenase